MAKYCVTVDTGGTFSDFVFFNEETGEIGITSDLPARKSFFYKVQYEQQLMAQLTQIGIWERAESPAQAAIVNGFDLIH